MKINRTANAAYEHIYLHTYIPSTYKINSYTFCEPFNDDRFSHFRLKWRHVFSLEDA